MDCLHQGNEGWAAMTAISHCLVDTKPMTRNVLPNHPLQFTRKKKKDGVFVFYVSQKSTIILLTTTESDKSYKRFLS